ncbi:hypothetical protein [Streptomyces sp. NPDC087212]|uniref:hypothetical protein n=1 Tax=Streptomyces sp. NPDC087212 TaxID=3365766 RepID=UPI0038205DDB
MPARSHPAHRERFHGLPVHVCGGPSEQGRTRARPAPTAALLRRHPEPHGVAVGRTPNRRRPYPCEARHVVVGE